MYFWGIVLGNSVCLGVSQSSMIAVNYPKLVARADLHYDKPVARSEDGLPVGNGRMGSLLWTSPSALKFQINRVDVYANNCTTNSFNARDWDYAYGCGYVDIDCVDFGPAVFPEGNCKQHLDVYNALASIQGRGIEARVLAWQEQDVMAIEITDNRNEPTVINANLRMLRHLAKSYPGQEAEYRLRRSSVVKTRNHTATSKLRIRDNRIILIQEFEEEDYYCSSAVAIAVQGRQSRAKIANVTEARLAAEPGRGVFTVFIASAASFNRDDDVVDMAIGRLEAAAARGFHGLLESNKKWWHAFWEKGFVYLHSADGSADYIEQNYTYFLYLMGSTSRGSLPPRYGGLIFETEGDYHHWGSQHWWNNVSFYYRGLPATNRVELMDPMFDMYTGMHDACSLAARQQWGSKGIFIPETTFFDGLARLPQDIAAEMRRLYLLQKPWDQRSKRFREFADVKHPHSSRWNWKGTGSWVDGRWVYEDRGQGPFGPVVHLFSTTADIAYMYWLRYEYTQDADWLRNRAYPMIKGAAEFYRNYPHVKKGPDGMYHIYHLNNHETWRGYHQDTMFEICAMRGILPVAIRSAQILETDDNLRTLWRDLLDNLAPLPTEEDRKSGTRYTSPHPLYSFDLVTLETDDPKVRRTAQATFFPEGREYNEKIHILSRKSLAAAMMGRSDLVKAMIVDQLRCLRPKRDFCRFEQTGRTAVLANRMTLREGVNAIGAQRLGLASDCMLLALCQSVPPGPAQEPIIRVFPAWPPEWDAAFTVLCRGGFLVTSSRQNGNIDFVEIKSQTGGQCRLRNPWYPGEVTLYQDGRRWQVAGGSLLNFATRRGQIFVIVPKGVSPSKLKRVVLP